MHIDARKINNGSIIEGDVCIVGTGPAGISMALQWINTPYTVILLEGGGFDYDDRVQDLYGGKTTGQKYYPLRSARLHYFGGTSGHWAGMCSPFDPIDFEKRDWIDYSGWPIKRSDLDGFYERAQPILDLAPNPYSIDFWKKEVPEFVPLPIGDDVVWNKIWQFSPPTRFGDKYRDTILKAKNIHLYTYANVTDIHTNEKGSSATSVTVKNHEGKEHTVKAKYFALACCSIQNARLLLVSNKQASKGLGNDHDNVGRYFMEHLEIKTGELWLNQSHKMGLYQFDIGKPTAYAELGIKPEKQAEHKILNGTSALMPLDAARNMKPAIESWVEEDPRAALDSMMTSFQKGGEAKPTEQNQNAYQLFTRIEQAPNPNSRITLDTEKDALGVPRSTLHWELTALEKRSIRKIQELIGIEVGKSGIGRVKLLDYLKDPDDMSWPSFTGGGWHHMGTTRMSQDPKQGVVDSNCKVHTVDNLFVAGASCYTTSAAPNPTLTVVALSLRLADHMKERAKKELV